jgi:hypothetical protein
MGLSRIRPSAEVHNGKLACLGKRQTLSQLTSLTIVVSVLCTPY